MDDGRPQELCDTHLGEFMLSQSIPHSLQSWGSSARANPSSLSATCLYMCTHCHPGQRSTTSLCWSGSAVETRRAGPSLSAPLSASLAGFGQHTRSRIPSTCPAPCTRWSPCPGPWGTCNCLQQCQRCSTASIAWASWLVVCPIRLVRVLSRTAACPSADIDLACNCAHGSLCRSHLHRFDWHDSGDSHHLLSKQLHACARSHPVEITWAAAEICICRLVLLLHAHCLLKSHINSRTGLWACQAQRCGRPFA